MCLRKITFSIFLNFASAVFYKTFFKCFDFSFNLFYFKLVCQKRCTYLYKPLEGFSSWIVFYTAFFLT